MRRRIRPVRALIAGMAILALGGCQEQILDRPLVKEKGVYTGQIDQDLTDDQVDALRRRGELQGF